MAVLLCSTILVSQPNEGECTSLLPSCLPCDIDCTSNAPGHGAGLDIRFGPWNLWHLQQRPFRSSLSGPVFHKSIAGYIFLAIIIKRGSGFTLIFISYFKTSLMTFMHVFMHECWGHQSYIWWPNVLQPQTLSSGQKWCSVPTRLLTFIE